MNAKGDLIALAQTQDLGKPTFDTVQDGPPHAPQFTTTIRLGGEVVAEASGRTKRDAERAASEAALARLRGEPEPDAEPEPELALPTRTRTAVRRAPPAEPIPERPTVPLPIYAEVLSQALLVAHERAPLDATTEEIRHDTVRLYAGLLRDLGVVDG